MPNHANNKVDETRVVIWCTENSEKTARSGFRQEAKKVYGTANHSSCPATSASRSITAAAAMCRTALFGPMLYVKVTLCRSVQFLAVATQVRRLCDINLLFMPSWIMWNL